MSLRPSLVPPVPAETARIARAAFPKGHPYLTLRDRLDILFTDEHFASLFPAGGPPAAAPWRLALVLLLQFAEALSDRQAAEAVRGRLEWKYLLSLEVTDPGFDFSVLSEFRDRLLRHRAESLLFDLLLTRFRELHLLKERGRQRTDSTHIQAVVRELNRLETVGETVRHTLDILASVAPDWLLQHAHPDWHDRYARPFTEWRLPQTAPQRQALAETIGADGHALLNAILGPDAPEWLPQVPAVQTLRRVWLQQYVLTPWAEGTPPPAAPPVRSEPQVGNCSPARVGAPARGAKREVAARVTESRVTQSSVTESSVTESSVTESTRDVPPEEPHPTPPRELAQETAVVPDPAGDPPPAVFLAHSRFQLRWRTFPELPPAPLRLISPYDPEARASEKRGKRWLGYKVHFTETCDPEQPVLIVSVHTAPAGEIDSDALPEIHAGLRDRNLLPSTHYTDGGYIDAGTLLSSRTEYHLDLRGPAPRDTSWQAQAQAGFAAADFELHWAEQWARCPAGKRSFSWVTKQQRGQEVLQVSFRPEDCGACRVREQCTQAARGRRLTLRPEAEYAALAAARARQEEPTFAASCAPRAGVEGTHAQALRVCEVRRSRYVGKAKTHLQHVLSAAALNLLRVAEWWHETPQARTRRSAWVRLCAAS